MGPRDFKIVEGLLGKEAAAFKIPAAKSLKRFMESFGPGIFKRTYYFLTSFNFCVLFQYISFTIFLKSKTSIQC